MRQQEQGGISLQATALTESEPLPTRFVLLADDSPSLTRIQKQSFIDIPGLVPITIDASTPELFAQQVAGISPDSIAMVVIDQYTAMKPLHDAANAYLEVLREQNPSAWIIETGATAASQEYAASDTVVQGIDLFPILERTTNAPKTADARLAAMKVWSVKAFSEAELADPASAAEKQPFDANRSFIRATENARFDAALQKIELPLEILKARLDTLNPEQQRICLHHLWHIIGHITIGTDADYYDLAVQQLKMLLE